MAGHSKWANIKHRKGANDAKKAKFFTKAIREITAAVRQAGGSLDTNARLRLAVQNAKGINMPKENIERAIKKASGAEGVDYTQVTYEGYGPYGVALIIECTTDNLNRTVSNVRSVLNKYEGSLGKNGSLGFVFERKGFFTFQSTLITEDQEEFSLGLIDVGADELEEEEGICYINCPMEDFGRTQAYLDRQNIEATSAGLHYVPSTQVELNEAARERVLRLIELLEDDDDVQKVYHNLTL